MGMEGRITALKVQKRNPNRVNVYLDGEYAFGLARVVAAWLNVGQEISAEQVEKLRSQDTYEAAFQSALRLLSLRPRAEAEIKQRLVRKGFAEAVIDETLERLREKNLVDDSQFALAWVENQSTFRPRGRRLLKMELRQKGVPEPKIEQALDEMQDEADLAYQAAERAAQRMSGLEWQQFRLKLSQFLARRGFSYEVVSQTVARRWKEIQTSTDRDYTTDTNDIEED
jgi:regulatory protein